MIEAREVTDRDEWLKWREADFGASIAGCLFGADVHPYTTAYEQWALKSGLVKPRAFAAALARRGHYVEKFAPDLIAEERPNWLVTPSRRYYRDPEARIGATPDLDALREDGPGLIDVKSVGYQTFRKWRDRDTGDTELPVWVAIQVNIQVAMVAGAKWGAVAAITIGDQGLDIEILDVPILPGIFDNFRELARDFWRRVEEKNPYPINWGRDVGTILDMHRDEDGSTIDLSDDLEFANFLSWREDYKLLERDGAKAEALRKLVDAQIIHRMGNAMTARYRGALIKAPTVRVKEAVRKAYSFRRLTIIGNEARDPATLADDAAE